MWFSSYITVSSAKFYRLSSTVFYQSRNILNAYYNVFLQQTYKYFTSPNTTT